MLIVLLISFLACFKPITPGDINAARDLFKGESNCVEAIRDIMKKSDCKELRYSQPSELEVMFQCNMEDSEREDFWETMIFRVSPWALRHRSIEVAPRNTRALCLDEYIIIEAFHPKELRETVK